MRRYITLSKKVGETPLQCIEAYRSEHPEYAQVPLAYAGRLDPMAEGLLLVLIGDECKQQERYHNLEKEYVVEILFDTSSDSGDVLGRLTDHSPTSIDESMLRSTLKTLRGAITLPYPHFSSKTVQGKPLFLWTLEGRLDDIDIPSKTSWIHYLELEQLMEVAADTVVREALRKINALPEVTEPTKTLGEDFRRGDIRHDWQTWKARHAGETCTIARIRCIASSGTYMRSLAEEIGAKLGRKALAYSIRRTVIGSYLPLPFGYGFWYRSY